MALFNIEQAINGIAAAVKGSFELEIIDHQTNITSNYSTTSSIHLGVSGTTWSHTSGDKKEHIFVWSNILGYQSSTGYGHIGFGYTLDSTTNVEITPLGYFPFGNAWTNTMIAAHIELAPNTLIDLMLLAYTGGSGTINLSRGTNYAPHYTGVILKSNTL